MVKGSEHKMSYYYGRLDPIENELADHVHEAVSDMAGPFVIDFAKDHGFLEKDLNDEYIIPSDLTELRKRIEDKIYWDLWNRE